MRRLPRGGGDLHGRAESVHGGAGGVEVPSACPSPNSESLCPWMSRVGALTWAFVRAGLLGR